MEHLGMLGMLARRVAVWRDGCYERGGGDTVQGSIDGIDGIDDMDGDGIDGAA